MDEATFTALLSSFTERRDQYFRCLGKLVYDVCESGRYSNSNYQVTLDALRKAYSSIGFLEFTLPRAPYKERKELSAQYDDNVRVRDHYQHFLGKIFFNDYNLSPKLNGFGNEIQEYVIALGEITRKIDEISIGTSVLMPEDVEHVFRHPNQERMKWAQVFPPKILVQYVPVYISGHPDLPNINESPYQYGQNMLSFLLLKTGELALVSETELIFTIPLSDVEKVGVELFSEEHELPMTINVRTRNHGMAFDRNHGYNNQPFSNQYGFNNYFSNTYTSGTITPVRSIKIDHYFLNIDFLYRGIIKNTLSLHYGAEVHAPGGDALIIQKYMVDKIEEAITPKETNKDYEERLSLPPVEREPVQYCTNCGARLDPKRDIKFCTKCGAKLD